jgi:hypothetical protein
LLLQPAQVLKALGAFFLPYIAILFLPY